MKQYVVIILFVLSLLGTITYSFFVIEDTQKQSKVMKTSKKKKKSESFFIGIDYYLIKENKKNIFLNAKELNINSTDSINTFVGPKGIAYSDDESPIKYAAELGNYFTKKEFLELEGSVFIEGNNFKSFSNSGSYEAKKDKIKAIGEVKTETTSLTTGDKVEVFSDRSIAFPKQEYSKFFGDVKGTIDRKRAYEEDINFASDTLTLNMPKSLILLDGDAHVDKPNFESSALKGEIFLENYNKKLKYFALYDDVKVKEVLELENGSKLIRRAYGEKLLGLQSEEKYILSGYPKVIQGEDIIKGNQVILRENNEVVEVDDANSNFLLK